jgi:hypothetical protein
LLPGLLGDDRLDRFRHRRRARQRADVDAAFRTGDLAPCSRLRPLRPHVHGNRASLDRRLNRGASNDPNPIRGVRRELGSVELEAEPSIDVGDALSIELAERQTIPRHPLLQVGIASAFGVGRQRRVEVDAQARARQRS